MRTTLLLALIAFGMVACSGGERDTQVTSIPLADLTAAAQATPSPTPTLDPTEDTPQATPTPAGPTPTPLDLNLPVGSAMQIAEATDIALAPTPRSLVSFQAFPVRLAFSDFYDGYNLRTGLVLSDKLVSLDGKRVTLEGYMAPPLKPELDYFVLTRIRLAFCPFCSTAGDWPDDIALVYLTNASTTATELPVRITGRLEVGASIDQETGMVSLVRVYADEMEILN